MSTSQPLASFSYQLRADSGYSNKSTGHRVSVDQYVGILRILDDVPPAEQKPYTMVQVPAISINHLSPETQQKLHIAVQDYAGLVAPHDNGFFLTVPGHDTQALAPDDLKAIYKFMEGRAPYGWFMLDVDGDIQPELTMYGG